MESGKENMPQGNTQTNTLVWKCQQALKTIPKTVTTKGVNCFQPNRYIFKNNAGFANLYPTINNTDANTDRGILFNKFGIKITEINNKKP